MPLSPAHENSIQFVLGRAPIGFALFVFVAIGTLFFYPLHTLILLCSMLFGVLVAALIFVSLRYYHFWLSWLIWVVPMTASAGTVLATLSQDGTINLSQILWQGFYFAATAIFGTLRAFRGLFLKWLRKLK